MPVHKYYVGNSEVGIPKTQRTFSPCLLPRVLDIWIWEWEGIRGGTQKKRWLCACVTMKIRRPGSSLMKKWHLRYLCVREWMLWLFQSDLGLLNEVASASNRTYLRQITGLGAEGAVIMEKEKPCPGLQGSTWERFHRSSRFYTEPKGFTRFKVPQEHPEPVESFKQIPLGGRQSPPMHIFLCSEPLYCVYYPLTFLVLLHLFSHC